MSGTVSMPTLQAAMATPALKFIQTNLISDGTIPAAQTDPNLVNPWGISFGPSTPLWISDQMTGKTSIDSINGATVTENVIPPVAVPLPTGQVFNSFPGAFMLSDGSPATFLFSSINGTLLGWNAGAGSAALVAAPNPGGAVYTGLAIGTSAGGPTLYAANNAKGTVDMFDSTFKPVGSFAPDPNLPAGFGPYNVQVLDDKVYVTYSRQDRATGAGQGFVNQYDLNGNFVARVATGGTLDDPWGLAIAPPTFGSLAGDLLVGNFGDGTINAFDRTTHTFAGQLSDGTKPLAIEGLWALTPGNGGAGGDKNTLYFTAGPTNEMHGLFGSIIAAPTT